jgi:hypothetical protein
MAYQITLKRLMLAVTLIAVALAMMRLICNGQSKWTSLEAFIACGCIGGAVDLLIRRRNTSSDGRISG